MCVNWREVAVLPTGGLRSLLSRMWCPWGSSQSSLSYLPDPGEGACRAPQAVDVAEVFTVLYLRGEWGTERCHLLFQCNPCNLRNKRMLPLLPHAKSNLKPCFPSDILYNLLLSYSPGQWIPTCTWGIAAWGAACGGTTIPWGLLPPSPTSGIWARGRKLSHFLLHSRARRVLFPLFFPYQNVPFTFLAADCLHMETLCGLW